MTKANTNDTLQKIEERVAPKLAAHQDAISPQPQALRARGGRLRPSRRASTPRRRFLVERYHRSFVRAGARLSEADQDAAPRAEQGGVVAQHRVRQEAPRRDQGRGARRRRPVRAGRDRATGRSPRRRRRAKERKLEGKWVLSLQNTTQQPAQVTAAEPRDARAPLPGLDRARGARGRQRHARASCSASPSCARTRPSSSAFPSYAAYVLDDQMAETPEKAIKLLTDMVPAAVAKARGEAAKMQALIDRSTGEQGERALQARARGTGSTTPSRSGRPSTRIDDEQVKPYLELDRVLEDGVFFAANKLYGSPSRSGTISRSTSRTCASSRCSTPTASPSRSSTRTTSSATTSPAARGWTSFVDQSGLLGTQPVVSNVCNFTKPAPGQPALLSFDDVTDDVPRVRPRAARPLVEREVPHPRRHQRAARLRRVPLAVQRALGDRAHGLRELRQALPDRARRCPPTSSRRSRRRSKFNQGFATTEYLAAALLDMAWHTLPEGAPRQDVDAFEAEALKRFKVDFALVPPRYRTELLRAHLGRRLRGRLLRVPLERGAGRTTPSSGSSRTAA